MPLHTENEGAVDCLNGFDNSVGCASADFHAPSRIRNRLLVKAVDRCGLGFDDLFESAFRFNLDGVSALCLGKLVVVGVRKVAGDVVMQLPGMVKCQKLSAVADP